jgi:hypothetical protein
LSARWLASKKNGADQGEESPEAAKLGSELVDRYEELRCQALGEMGRGLGMVLFIREGMKTWIEAWMNSVLRIAERPPSSLGSRLIVPPGVREEAILVLAGMALSIQAEVDRW